MAEQQKLQAFASYQATMHQFLQVQEALMDQLLSRKALMPGRLSAEGSPVQIPVSPTKEAPAKLPRCRILACPRSLPADSSNQPDGLYLIIADSIGVAPLLAQALELRGAEVLVLSAQQLASEQAISQLDLASYRPLQGIVHLAPLQIGERVGSLVEWRSSSQIYVKGFFRLIQQCLADLQKNTQPRVLAASLLGGYFGRGQRSVSGLATSGGNLGLLKTLAVEYPQIHVKGVDCDQQPPKAMADQILRELLTTDPEIEVGYPDGKRTVFTAIPAPLEPVQRLTEQPSADWVLLVTGGARGITAEVLKSLVVPGMCLILVGRSPLQPAESATTACLEDPDQLRQQLVADAKVEGRNITPKQIEHELKSLLNNRQIQHNLDWFRMRCRVEYHAIDARDSEVL